MIGNTVLAQVGLDGCINKLFGLSLRVHTERSVGMVICWHKASLSIDKSLEKGKVTS